MLIQIRLSSLVLALVLSVGVVAALIALRPPLTQAYYVQLGALIAGAGLIVTVYNRVVSARTGHRVVPETAEEETISIARAEIAAQIPAAAPAALMVEVDAEIAAPDAAAEELPESMDALLDAAHAASADDPQRAIRAYSRALERYEDDSYVPYLIIELSTLYRSLGDYAAALALFDRALALPVVAQDTVMLQEFCRSRRYLGIVSDMLAARGTPGLPFGEVPAELLAEADLRTQEQTIV